MGNYYPDRKHNICSSSNVQGTERWGHRVTLYRYVVARSNKAIGDNATGAMGWYICSPRYSLSSTVSRSPSRHSNTWLATTPTNITHSPAEEEPEPGPFS
mmetsp:Transcript_37857/g.77049  ORF Transcript_37857/g.77049 Transcript_37857/m.77049 type:complete len:100 (+) Transcript_37857:582-881(+)